MVRLYEDVRPDPARVADGWTRRFIADGHRAREVMQLYAELGYEVVADPVQAADLPPGCDECRLAELLKLTTIYTRRSRVDEGAR